VASAFGLIGSEGLERMKIWQQGLLLLGLPLITELAFCTYLADNMLQLDRAALKEAQAKQVLAACQEIRLTMLRLVTSETARRFVSLNDCVSVRDDFDNLMIKEVQVLKAATARVPESSLAIDQYCQALERFRTTFSDAIVKSEPGFQDSKRVVWSRFIDEHEYLEEVFLSLGRIASGEQRIRNIFVPIAKELQPDLVRRRAQVIPLIVSGALLNVVLVAILALALGQKTLARLSALMSNMQSFAERKNELVLLRGDDELAEVDQKFNQIASERNRAEQFRNTLLETMTHDIRSPLSSAMLTLEMVLWEPASEKNSGRLRRLCSELKRLVRMADGILSIGRIECGRFELQKESIRIEQLLEPALDAMRGIAEAKQVELRTSYVSDHLVCDADKLIQVLVNLLSNALKFAPARSDITITVRKNQGCVRFEIKDQGPGVPIELQANLFKRFVQLDQEVNIKKHGTGLGLYVSALLVESHAGAIGVLTPADGGACFWFEIPSNETE
jgi:signal transduction histidine kinase